MKAIVALYTTVLMIAACSTPAPDHTRVPDAANTTTPLAMWTFGGGTAELTATGGHTPHALTIPAAGDVSAAVTLQFGQAYASGSVVASTAANRSCGLTGADVTPDTLPVDANDRPILYLSLYTAEGNSFPEVPAITIAAEAGGPIAKTVAGIATMPGSPNCVVDFYAGMFHMASADWGGIGGFSTLATDGTSVVIPANSLPGGPFDLTPGQTLMSVTCFAGP
jgi:hypothetical protein